MRALNAIRKLNRDTRGMSTVEYALLLVLIVAGSVTVWKSIGKKVADSVSTSDAQIQQLGMQTGQAEQK